MTTQYFQHSFFTNGERLKLQGDGVTVTHLTIIPREDVTEEILKEEVPCYTDAVEWLNRYFNGDQPAPLSLKSTLGTAFQRLCWEIIATIPYGQTISYTELAFKAGNPKAVRAAASACGANLLPLLIPCHRVIAKNGGLGGFAWGISYKKRLLEAEQFRTLCTS
jgi:O-6-methylguanine DNA methyltransferase